MTNKFSDEQMDVLRKQVHDFKCPNCGHNEHSVSDNVFQLVSHQMGDGGLVVNCEFNYLRLFAKTCSKCGFVSFFNSDKVLP